MATISGTTTTSGLSQFGDIGPSQDSGTEKLFGFKKDLGELIDYVPGLYQALDALPWSYMTSEGFFIDTPGLAGYDIKGKVTAGIDIGLYASYQYDFGTISAKATVQADRPSSSSKLFGSYTLDTASTLLTVDLASQPGTEPFALKLFTASADSSTVGASAYLDAGIGIYEGSSEYKGLSFNKTVDLSATIFDKQVQQTDALTLEGVPYVSGTLGVPRLPALNTSASVRGAETLSTGSDSGSQEFGRLRVDIDGIVEDAVPVFKAINQGQVGFFSWFLDVGVSWQVIDLNVGPTLSIEQTLGLQILDTAVDVIVETKTGANSYAFVEHEQGHIGDAFVLDFAQGANISRVTEIYTPTIRINTDIDLAIGMTIDLRLGHIKGFINPVLIDEISKSFDLVNTSITIPIAAIELVSDDSYIVTLAPITLQWSAQTFVDFKGTDAGETTNLNVVPTQVNFEALGGDDQVFGNAQSNHIDGGAGNDLLFGGFNFPGEADTLIGGAGADTLYGGGGGDLLQTGANFTGLLEKAYGEGGNDRIEVERVRGVFDGGDGDDTISVKLTAGQVITGGKGVDTLVLDGAIFSAPFVLDLTTTPNSFLQYGLSAAPADRSSQEGFEAWNLTLSSGDDSVKGGALADTLAGGAGADTLDGGAGDDSLLGGAGDDSLLGNLGDDTLEGGDGADLVSGGSGDDSLRGGDGADTLRGVQGDDRLYGGAGDDLLQGGIGANYFQGGTGDDTIEATGADTAFGEEGDDLVIGGSKAAFLSGGAGDDTIRPGSGGGVLSGNAGADRFEITNLSGPTTIWGGGANNPNQNDDAIDTLVFNAAALATFGGAGTPGSPLYVPPFTPPANVVPIVLDPEGSLGQIRFFGIDAFDVTAGSLADVLVGSSGQDTLRGGGGGDFLDGRGGRDSLDGGSGDDTIAGQAIDSIDGGAGTDLLLLDLLGNLVAGGGRGGIATLSPRDIRFGIGAPEGGAAPLGTNNLGAAPSGIERLRVIVASAGDDTLSGGLLADTLIGGAGNDDLSGDAGDDVIDGGDGRDTIDGGEGDDDIDARGQDTLSAPVASGFFQPRSPRYGWGDVVFGGAGNDKISVSRTATYVDGGTGDDTIISVDFGGLAGASATLQGGAGADRILGNDLAERILGGPDPLDTEGEQPDTPPILTDGADSLAGYGGDDTIDGGAGDDSLYGMDGSDRLDGGSGNDRLEGGAGTDFLFGGSGNDRLLGGDDGDAMVGGLGNDTLLGEAGDDQLAGADGADSLDGGDGRDTLEGGLGADILFGGLGDDELFGNDGADLLSGGFGANYAEAGAGNDQVIVVSLADRADGGDGTDTLIVTAPADAASPVSIGADIGQGLQSMGGGGWFRNFERAQITGTRFADQLTGTAGADTLIGGQGADTLTGGKADDIIRLGTGITITGAPSPFDGAPDLVLVFNGDANDRVENFDPTLDRLIVAGTQLPTLGLLESAEGTIVRGPNTNTLLVGVTLRQAIAARAEGRIAAVQLAQPKPDALVISSGATALFAPALLLANDSGSALAFAGIATAPVGIRAQLVGDQLQVQQFLNSGGGGFQYRAENIAGSSTAPVSVTVLAATSAADLLDASSLNATATWLDGLSGDDTIIGGSGADRLIGSDGADSLVGAAGQDTLEGGAGHDTLDGGPGPDTLAGGPGDDLYRIDDPQDVVTEGPGAGIDRIAAAATYTLPVFVENGTAEAPGITLTGNASNNILGVSASAGAALEGLGGQDTLTGGRFADTLSGGDGDDRLSGSAGDDALDGGAGADTLIGGPGADLLTGGDGPDLFVFDLVDRLSQDTILDFDTTRIGRATPTDRIDLSALDADATTPGNQAFTYIGASAFTAPGQLRITETPDGFQRLDLNLDADLAPDMAILILAPEPLTPIHFVL